VKTGSGQGNITLQCAGHILNEKLSVKMLEFEILDRQNVCRSPRPKKITFMSDSKIFKIYSEHSSACQCGTLKLQCEGNGGKVSAAAIDGYIFLL
jgi:hypothetical protein